MAGSLDNEKAILQQRVTEVETLGDQLTGAAADRAKDAPAQLDRKMDTFGGRSARSRASFQTRQTPTSTKRRSMDFSRWASFTASASCERRSRPYSREPARS